MPDVEHEMKKVIPPSPTLHHFQHFNHVQLLRHFHRVISSPSLGEDEECPICAESLELIKCSRLVSLCSVLRILVIHRAQAYHASMFSAIAVYPK